MTPGLSEKIRGKVLLNWLPANPVVFPVVTAASPETTMFPVKIDGIDGAAGTVIEAQGISHFFQLIPDFLRNMTTQ